MIVNHYTPLNLFALVPQLTLEMDPVLAVLDQLLEDDSLFARVRGDLSARQHQVDAGSFNAALQYDDHSGRQEELIS